MWLTFNVCQLRFELVQRCTGVTDDLRAAVDEIDAVNAQGVDDDNGAIIVIAIGRGTAGQAGVGRLANDYHIGQMAGFDHFPLLDHIRRQDDRQCIAATKAKTGSVFVCFRRVGDEVFGTDNGVETIDQRLVIIWRRHGVCPLVWFFAMSVVVPR